MKQRVVLGFLAAFAFLVPASAAEDYTQWAAYKTITLNTTASGANIAINPNNFPILVRLSSAEADVFNASMTNGEDIRFAKTDGVTRLQHQIERWDKAGQTAEIWIKIDTVLGNNNTQAIRMYWGKSGSADSSNGPGVFSASNNYQGVWHLNQAGNNNTANYADATGTFPGTGSNMTAGSSVSGTVAQATAFTGSGTNLNYIGNLLTTPGSSAAHTVSFWMKANAYGNQVTIDKNPNDASGVGWAFKLRSVADSGLWYRVGSETAGARTDLQKKGAYSVGNWVYVAGTFDGAGNAKLYVNGALAASATGVTQAVNNTTTNLRIGVPSVSATAERFNGTLDEVEISVVAHSADWIKLEFENRKPVQTLVNLGGSVAQTPPSNLSYSSNPATYGQNVAIANNNPTVTGTVASYGINPALPAGLSLNTSSGVISGTPTVVAAAADYTVTATNAAGSTTATVNITVIAAPSGLSYPTNPATYATGIAITPNSPSVTGVVTSYSVSPALPAGLSLNTSSGIVSGTPTAAAAATNYLVSATNIAGSATVNLNVTVIAPPSGLTYKVNPAVFGANIAITPDTPSVTGSVTSYSVNPALPAGLGLNTTTGIVTGTPTVAAAQATYTVTAANAGGSTTVGLQITVVAPPANLTYSQNPAVYPINAAITNNSPTITGAVSSYSINPALPAGLGFNTGSGVISGTPTVAAAQTDYTVTATNVAGSTTATVRITVLGAPSGLTYSQNPALYGLSIGITPNTPTVNGTITNYSVSPALPAGLALDTVTGAISGTPTAASAAADYTVTASNAVGSTQVAVNITVIAPPTGLTYRTNPASFLLSAPIVPDSPQVSGAIASYSISPALPAGLSFNTSTGIVSGTPTALSPAANYQVTAQNMAGSTNAILNIAVLVPPSGLTYSSSPASYTIGTAITPNNPSVTGTVSGYSVNPALPAGLGLNGTSGIITGTPTAASAAANYTVTASNGVGSTTFVLNITVGFNVQPPLTLSYSTNPAVYGVGTAVTANTPSHTGGDPTHYAVSPALPGGLAIDTATGVISGTPTAASAAASYVVAASNVAGSANDTISIRVLSAPSNLSYSVQTAQYTERVAITPNNPTVTGTVTRYSVSPPLPAGLSIDSVTGVISGTPSSASSQGDYVVSAENPAGAALDTLSIAVQLVAPSNLVYPTNPVSYQVGSDVTPNIPTVTGSVTDYSINPPLPPGLNLDAGSGMIWGKPTLAASAADYVITATNTAGSTTATVNLAVTPSTALFAKRENGAFALRLPGSSALWFHLPESGLRQVRLDILNLRGEIVWSQTVSTNALMGDLAWNGSTRGGPASNGVYLARLSAWDQKQRQTLLEQKRLFLLR